MVSEVQQPILAEGRDAAFSEGHRDVHLVRNDCKVNQEYSLRI